LLNGVARGFTSVSGQNPTWLQFNLGGDPGETAGGVNTTTVSVSDDTGSATHFVLRYFRLAAGPSGGAPTISPGTTEKATPPPPKAGKKPRPSATAPPTTTTTSTQSPTPTKKPLGHKATKSGTGPKRQGARRRAGKGRGSRA
jgi:hypothetical protein